MEMVSPMPGQCHGDIITMCVTWSTHTTLGRFTFGHIHSSRYIALLGWSTTTGHIPRTVSSRPGAPHPPTTILVADPIKLLLLAGPILDLIHTPEPERPAYGPPESWRKTRPAVFLFQSFSRVCFSAVLLDGSWPIGMATWHVGIGLVVDLVKWIVTLLLSVGFPATLTFLTNFCFRFLSTQNVSDVIILGNTHHIWYIYHMMIP